MIEIVLLALALARQQNCLNYQLLASLQFRVIRYYETVYESFGNKLYRQLVGIPMGTNCAPVVADLLFFFALK